MVSPDFRTYLPSTGSTPPPPDPLRLDISMTPTDWPKMVRDISFYYSF